MSAADASYVIYCEDCMWFRPPIDLVRRRIDASCQNPAVLALTAGAVSRKQQTADRVTCAFARGATGPCGHGAVLFRYPEKLA